MLESLCTSMKILQLFHLMNIVVIQSILLPSKFILYPLMPLPYSPEKLLASDRCQQWQYSAEQLIINQVFPFSDPLMPYRLKEYIPMIHTHRHRIYIHVC